MNADSYLNFSAKTYCCTKCQLIVKAETNTDWLFGLLVFRYMRILQFTCLLAAFLVLLMTSSW